MCIHVERWIANVSAQRTVQLCYRGFITLIWLLYGVPDVVRTYHQALSAFLKLMRLFCDSKWAQAWGGAVRVGSLENGRTRCYSWDA
jgi:hypothetical protein